MNDQTGTPTSVCSRCNQPYSKNDKTKYTHKWCRDCYLAYYRNYNYNRRDKQHNSRAYLEDRKQQRAANKLALVNAHGGRCKICGYAKSASALDFDHLSSEGESFQPKGKKNENKQHAISMLLASADPEVFKQAVREAERCILICSNCHRERTFPGMQLSEAPVETIDQAVDRLKTRIEKLRRQNGSNEKRSTAARQSSAVRALADRAQQPVESEDPVTGDVRYYPSLVDAGKAGYNPSCISLAINGKIKKHKRLIWRKVSKKLLDMPF